jgi:copper chaperone CopZ
MWSTKSFNKNLKAAAFDGKLAMENIMLKFILGRKEPGGRRSLETRRIGVKGMSDKAQALTVKKALLTKSGVREVYINRDEGVVTVSFDPTQTGVPELSDVILRKGYFPNPLEN